MIKLQNTVRTSVSPDEAWKVVGDIEGIASWVPGLTGATFDGETRVCTMGDGTKIVERIENRDDAARSYGYTHIETPMPVKSSRGSFRVEADGDGAVVVWDSEIEPADPAMADQLKGMLEGPYRETMESLGRLLEGAGARN